MSKTNNSESDDAIQKALDYAAAEAERRGEELNEYDMMKIIRKERKIARQKKAPNYIEMAKQEGLNLKKFNGDSHFLVNGRYDWWPSSGAWRDRTKPYSKTQYGFWRLVNRAKDKRPTL